MADPASSLTPGSDSAVAAGCICPVLDNSHGEGWMGSGMFITAEGCPIHIPVKDEAEEALIRGEL